MARSRKPVAPPLSRQSPPPEHPRAKHPSAKAPTAKSPIAKPMTKTEARLAAARAAQATEGSPPVTSGQRMITAFFGLRSN